MTKALSKENLAYYDNKAKKLQVKDVSLENDKLKITKRDNTSKLINLPSGGSFKYNINKRYTTVYLTEDAVRYLGYSDFEDAKAIKYRSRVCFRSAAEQPYSQPTPGTAYGVSNAKGSTIQGSSGDYLYELNPNLRVNVFEPKTIDYLGELTDYFFGPSFNNIINENNLNTKLDTDLISAGKVNVHFYTVLFGSDGNMKSYVKFQSAIRRLYDRSSPVTSFEGPNGIVNTSFYSRPVRDYVNDHILNQFENGDSIYIAVFNDSYDAVYPEVNIYGQDAYVEFQTLDELNNAINNIDSDATIVKLYDYDSFQDIIKPISVDVLPIQIPSNYIQGHIYGQHDSYFDNYAFYLRLYDNVDYINIHGQNVGNGIIIGNQMTYIGVSEEDNTCGTTEFTEIYPM